LRLSVTAKYKPFQIKEAIEHYQRGGTGAPRTQDLADELRHAIQPRHAPVERDRSTGRNPPVRDSRTGAAAGAANLASGYLTEQREDRFQVEWIPDLLDAMFRLQHPRVDVVLLDLGLPERDGDQSFRDSRNDAGGNSHCDPHR
jgi:hypothetical protein